VSLLGIRISITWSGKNGVLIGYRTTMTMFGFSTSEAGKSIVEPIGRSQNLLIGTFMLLLFGQVYKLGTPIRLFG
jgi:hypothetical protein